MAHAVVLILLIVIPLYVVYRRFVRRAQLPPGPPGLPLVGNVRDIPAPHEFPWLKYHEWCRKYNTEILRLNALGMNMIIVDTMDAAKELLDKRSSIYSERPRMVMITELAGFDWNFGSMDYNNDWRVCRKMTHQEFHATSFKKYRPVLAKHAYDLVRRLAADSGSRIPLHLKHMVGANIMEVTYGIKVLPEHDPFIELAEAGQECVGRCATGGMYLVELLPFLKYLPTWFPGAKFRREAEAWHQKATRQLHVPYEDFVDRLKAGQVEDCMAKALLDFGDDKETERVARMTTATMYMGGSETIAATMHSFTLAMLLYPDVQARARYEIEKVLGPHRLPTFDDLGSVPYVDALIKETLRWHPIVPLDLPHKLRDDDTYAGYHLDKGSLVMVNIWAILHDEKHYPDPHTFNPDRFLRKDGALNPDVLDPSEAAFGFGRRVCPGQHMAYDTMWIAIACVLVCLQIGKAKDEEGKEVEVRENFVSSFVSEPKPFPCEIRFRSQQYEAQLGAL